MGVAHIEGCGFPPNMRFPSGGHRIPGCSLVPSLGTGARLYWRIVPTRNSGPPQSGSHVSNTGLPVPSVKPGDADHLIIDHPALFPALVLLSVSLYSGPHGRLYPVYPTYNEQDSRQFVTHT